MRTGVCMRRVLYLLIDLALVALATVLASALRDNFVSSPARLEALLPYLALTLLSATVVLLIAGVERAIWRLSGMVDYLRVLACVTVIVLATVALGFVINRLDGIARALPVIQALGMGFLLISARVAMRLRHARRQEPAPPFNANPLRLHETIILVGLNSVTELFLRAAAEFVPQGLRVAGIVASKERHRGRRLRQYPILGIPEDLVSILQTLSVHGISVDRIVITSQLDSLSPAARETLLKIEKTSDITLDFFAERIGFHAQKLEFPSASDLAPKPPSSNEDDPLKFRAAELEQMAQRPYLRAKRLLDLTLAALMVPLALPLIVLIAAVVALDVGTPLIFWQQRPGARGRPFRLYKFRTMASAHDDHGRRVPDRERSSALGEFLRRTRLDELPQLYNIIVGDMSFVGPRPLLPIDQAVPCVAARLLVRPGLTGWAQVVGGRQISAPDKAAIDIWYVANATLLLDLKILIRTIPIVLFGERVDAEAAQLALRPEKLGIVRASAIEATSAPVALVNADTQHAA